MADLARFQRTIVDESGNIVPSPTITVRDQVTNALVSLYSDRGGTTGISNPFTGTSAGLAAFHVTGGVYKVTATSGAFTAEWTWVGVGTASEYDFTSITDYVDDAIAAAVPIPLTVALGGTGRTSLTANNIILGNGASAANFLAPGTSGNVVTSNGTTWTSAAPIVGVPSAIGQIPFSTDGATYTATQKITLATVAAASGTAVDFTGIPSWAERVTVMFAGVTVGGGVTRLQLATSGPTYVSSGYVGSYGFLAQGSTTQNSTNFSSSFLLADSSLTGLSGLVTLMKVDGNTWAESSTLGSSTTRHALGGGYITLSSALVALRLSSTTGASFSAGNINITYE
jgi:hypothetical protein